MEAYRLGLTEALAEIEAGRLTKDDYLESCIARAEAVEPTVHAFAYFDADAVRRSTSSSGPLAGIPVGIKDIIATAGMPTEMGSPAYRGHVPERSAWVVDALTNAGAIVFGKTVTTEFAWRKPGATRNPWNVAHTPAGSSSGSAAAVAYGAVPAALGTQTLGSVLRPAAFCGVVGYKPSYAAIPRTGVHPLAGSLDHVGMFTRSVDDVALLASALFGRDGIDVPMHAAIAPPWPLREPRGAPRIALWRTSRWDLASAEQRDCVEATARLLEASGATVTPLDLPASFDALWPAAPTIIDVEGAIVSGALADETPPRIGAPTLDLVARGRAIAAVDYVAARQTQQRLRLAFDALMAPFDAALTAPALGTAPAGLGDTGDAMFCTPASVLGVPAIALPAAIGAAGLPLGVQLIGRWSRDRELLETARWVERRLAWTYRFPPG